MGKVTWGGDVTGKDIDRAERRENRPYDGKTPPNGLYAWRLKVVKTGQSANGDDQLIVGMELLPRKSRPEEKAYRGYFLMEYLTIADNMTWRLGPFCDALGVSGDDLIKRTKDKGEEDRWGGKEVASIGEWKNNGDTIVLASIKDDTYNGQTRKRVDSFWPVEDAADDSGKKKGRDEDDEDDDDDDDEDDKPKGKKGAKKAAPKKAVSKKKPKDDDEDDEDDSDDDEDDEDDKPKKGKAKGKKPTSKKKSKKSKDDEDDDEDDDEEAPF